MFKFVRIGDIFPPGTLLEKGSDYDESLQWLVRRYERAVKNPDKRDVISLSQSIAARMPGVEVAYPCDPKLCAPFDAAKLINDCEARLRSAGAVNPKVILYPAAYVRWEPSDPREYGKMDRTYVNVEIVKW